MADVVAASQQERKEKKRSRGEDFSNIDRPTVCSQNMG